MAESTSSKPKHIKDVLYVSDDMTIREFKKLVGTECWVVDNHDKTPHQKPEVKKAFVVLADIHYVNELSGGVQLSLWVAQGSSADDAAWGGSFSRPERVRCWGFAKTPEAAIELHNRQMDARKLSNKDIKELSGK